MKPIYYNNPLAKLILFGNYHTIMLFGFILTKLNVLSETVFRHEKTHQKQYVECMEIAAVPAILLSAYVSLWWLLLIPTSTTCCILENGRCCLLNICTLITNAVYQKLTTWLILPYHLRKKPS